LSVSSCSSAIHPFSAEPNPEKPLLLGCGEVHLWCVFSDLIFDVNLLKKYKDILSVEENQKASRFYRHHDRQQFLLTRTTIRTLLSLYEPDVAARDWDFGKDNYGKPFIKNYHIIDDMQFSISHSRGLVVVALTRGSPIGVDVEATNGNGDNLGLAKRYFSKEEYANLTALPIEDQNKRFFDLWTLKEAYIKACGEGLSIPLDSFWYEFTDGGEMSIDFLPIRNDCANAWFFCQLYPSQMHVISVAVKKSEIENVADPIVSVNKYLPLMYAETVNCVEY